MTVPNGPGTGSIPTQKVPRREVVTSAEAKRFGTDGSMNDHSFSSAEWGQLQTGRRRPPRPRLATQWV